MNNGWARLAIIGVLMVTLASEAPAQWQIGAAKRDVTPSEPVLLTGYASRTKPSEGIDTKLWARALAIGTDQPHLVIAVDNCGVPAELTERVYQRVNQFQEMPRNNFVICSTHTHAPCWKNAAGNVELLYLPTWISAEDSAGFFLLVIHDESLVGDQPSALTISVKSAGDNSQRWFSVDKSGDAADALRRLFEEASD